MQITVELLGKKKLHTLAYNFPQILAKEMDIAEQGFIDYVQKNAKQRAPKFSGALANSIHKVRIQDGVWMLVVGSPYGWFQEKGWSDIRGLSAWTPSRSGYLVGDWISAHMDTSFGGYLPMGVTPRGIAQPFIQPAFESGIAHFPSILMRAVERAAKL